MINKLFLAKKKKDALVKRKSRIDFIFTTSIAILLGVFGIFISHYNSEKFTGESKTYNAIVTSKGFTNKTAVREINNKALINTPSIVSTTPLIVMFYLNSTSTTATPIDTTIDIFQINSNLFKLDCSIDGARRNASIQN